MLLSGDPGVGKTLTAKSVSKEMKRPLYSVTAGELGSDIKEIEKSLEKVLDLAARWNAVLLLDEADVFMEKRSSHEIERNNLVSVFLRILEYYKGILFVTTNREAAIDNAFKSRIDLSVHYPPLSIGTQKEIWRRFVVRSFPDAPSSFTDQDWATFTKRPMNGREIKNAVKRAHLLAAKREEDLDVAHINEVLQVLHENQWISPEPGNNKIWTALLGPFASAFFFYILGGDRMLATLTHVGVCSGGAE